MAQQTRSYESTMLRQSICAEYEETRNAFLALLETLSEADWQRRSANPAWTVGELMAHITQYNDVALPMLVKNARKGKAMRLPKWLANRVNVMMTRSYARKLTRLSIAQHYTAAHSAALTLLDDVNDDEWNLSTCFPDGKPVTIKALFHQHAHHFKEHAQQVRQGLHPEA